MSLAQSPRAVQEIPIALIDAPALPSRTQMNDEKMDQLVDDIRRNGLLQPIIVARVEDRFRVVAGHRRRIACERAGVVAPLCIIYPDETSALDAIQHSENKNREELNPADEAIWFSELLESKCDGDVDVLCARLGEKRSYVEGRLLLFQGDMEVFDRLKRGLISIGVAQTLNKCPDELTRRAWLMNAIVGGATISVVNRWLMDWKRAQALTGPQTEASPAPAPAGPVPQSNFFRCYCCHGTDNVHMLQPVNIHTYCLQAIVDKLLATYRGEA